MIQAIGGRKFALGLLYTGLSFALCAYAIHTGQRGSELLGVAALPTSIATGILAVVWGNVQEHKAKNGEP